MKVSPKGAFTIALDEGIVPARYYDLAGVATWGIGHTAKAGPPDPATMPLEMNTSPQVLSDIAQLFINDLDAYGAVVEREFGPMKQHEFDGWVSWHFNTGGAYSSSAVGKWRRGDKKGAVATLQQWNKATVNGRKVVTQALVERRAREAALILHGRYPADKTLPVWRTNNRGKVEWRPLSRLTMQEFARLAERTPTPDVEPEPVLRGRGGSAYNITATIVAALGAAAAAAATFWDQIKEWFVWPM